MRSCSIELDKVMGTEWPPDNVFHKGKTHTLTSIYQEAGIDITIIKGQEDLPNLPSGKNFDLPTMHKYMSTYKKQGVNGWYGYVLIVPEIAYLSNFFINRPLGVMYDFRSNDMNSIAREGCAMSFNRVSANPLLYMRTLAHELGHVFNLLHPKNEIPPAPIDTKLMNQTSDLQSLGNYPDNIEYEFSDSNKAWLGQAPSDFVRPGGRPLADRPEGADQLAQDDLIAITSNLKFTVSSRQEAYFFGEPVQLRFTLQNIGNNSVYIDPDLTCTSSNVTVTIISPSNQRVKFKPTYIECKEGVVYELKPSCKVLGNDDVFYGANGYVFQSVGVYKIFAQYHAVVEGKSVAAISEIHQIEIYTPKSESEFEISDILMQPSESLFLILRGGSHLNNAVQNLQRVVRRFRNQNATEYVKLALARHFIFESSRAVQYNLVIEIIESINRKFLDYEQKAECEGLLTILHRFRGEVPLSDASISKFAEVAEHCMPRSKIPLEKLSHYVNSLKVV